MPSSCCAAPPCIVVATIQCAKHFLNHSLPFQVQDNNPAHFKTGQAARFSASAAYLYTSSCPDTRQVCRGDLNSPIKTACCVSAYSLPPPPPPHLDGIAVSPWPWEYNPGTTFLLAVRDVTCRNDIVLICSHRYSGNLTVSLTYNTHSYSSFLHWQPGNASTHLKDRLNCYFLCPSKTEKNSY